MVLTHQCPPGVDHGTVKLSFQPHLGSSDLAEMEGKIRCAEDTFLPESVCNPYLQVWASRCHLLSEGRGSSSGLQVGVRLRVVHAWHHGCVHRTAGAVAGPGLTQEPGSR